jgi:hypothetical protein
MASPLCENDCWLHGAQTVDILDSLQITVFWSVVYFHYLQLYIKQTGLLYNRKSFYLHNKVLSRPNRDKEKKSWEHYMMKSFTFCTFDQILFLEIKTRRIRWRGDVAWMGKIRNVQ